jgi:hypothetical protein
MDRYLSPSGTNMSGPSDVEALTSPKPSDESAPKPQISSKSSTHAVDDGPESSKPIPVDNGGIVSSTCPSSIRYVVHMPALCMYLYLL